MNDRQTIVSADAPAPIGPYAQAIAAGGFVFCSGQVGMNPADGTLVGDEVGAQTQQAMANLGAVLHAAGLTFGDVVKTTIFLLDMNDFAVVNGIYADAFGEGAVPARSTIAVVGLPRGAKVEIEAIALRA
jgi:2-iminobutanoate/2-iminopropanoate deaminase